MQVTSTGQRGGYTIGELHIDIKGNTQGSEKRSEIFQKITAVLTDAFQGEKRWQVIVAELDSFYLEALEYFDHEVSREFLGQFRKAVIFLTHSRTDITNPVLFKNGSEATAFLAPFLDGHSLIIKFPQLKHS